MTARRLISVLASGLVLCGGCRKPVVICCHGLSGDIADTVPYGQAAATMGFVACCFDFCGSPRGYSLSDGERADNTLLTEVADLRIFRNPSVTPTTLSGGNIRRGLWTVSAQHDRRL